MSKSFIHLSISLLLAISIYLIFRIKIFYLFKLVNIPILHFFLKELQLQFLSIKAILPSWIIFSFPGGLWTYGFTTYFILQEKQSGIFSKKNTILLFTPTLSVGFELAQYLHFIPGTFDPIDLLFCLMGSVLPFLFYYHS